MGDLELTALAFLTAPSPTLKQLNRAFVLLATYEYGNGLADNIFMLARRKALDEQSLTRDVESTTVPFANGTLAVHEFVGMTWQESLNKVNSNFASIRDCGVDAEQWLIIDEEGLKTDTVLLVKRGNHDETDEEEDEDMPPMRDLATRLPMRDAWSMYSNLQIANMDFEDFVDEDSEDNNKPGFLPYTFAEDHDPAAEGKRRAVLRKMKDDNLIDAGDEELESPPDAQKEE